MAPSLSSSVHSSSTLWLPHQPPLLLWLRSTVPALCSQTTSREHRLEAITPKTGQDYSVINAYHAEACGEEISQCEA